MQRQLLALIAPLVTLLGLAALVFAAPPNVVIFLADDAGWGDYSINGNASVRTANIDSIGREGAQFEHFFVCPVCSPTRAEFLSGRYHPRGGVRGVSEGDERIDLDERTIADAFQAAGYATGAFGKWHNGSQWPYHPVARGFDEYFGYTSGHWGEYFDPPLEECSRKSGGRMVRAKGYMVDACTDRAIDFIKRNRERPFFCYVPFTTPHSPWAAAKEDWERWKDRQIEQRGNLGKEEAVNQTRCVMAMLENQDANVGRVLNKLEELGLKENTIVIYFSDNGPNTVRFNGGMRGRKGSTDEGGVRSLLLVRWPKRIAPNTFIPQIAGAIDLLPTLTSLAGIERVGEKPLDGMDLSPLLLDEGIVWDDRQLFNHWAGKTSVRTERYRLDSRGRLFDITIDPGQLEDISAKEPQIAAELALAAKQWRDDVLDKSRDERPFPVGYVECPWTQLPARDGRPHGGVKRSSSAPNCSYFVNWRRTDDRITWDIEVNTTGEYEVTIDYTCPAADAGATIELSFGESKLMGRVEPGWDPPLYTNQDTLPRPRGESQMKEFRPLRLGTIRLDKGRGLLTLRALDVPGESVMDVRRVNLTLLQ